MSERYQKLNSLPENLYAPGAPVIIVAGSLLKDQQRGAILAQLKLKSIAPGTIKAVKVKLSPLDTVGKPLGDEIFYEYLDLSAQRDAEFGQKSAIRFPNASTRAFRAEVTEVAFADNAVWTSDGSDWEPLEKAEAITEPELLKQYQLQYGNAAQYLVRTDRDLWHCSCGAVNHGGESVCHSCGIELHNLLECDMEKLKREMNERLAKEKAERDAREAAEKAKKDAQQQKTRKVLSIAIPITLVLGVAVVLVKIVIPETRYKKAASLWESGSFESAIATYEAIQGYKDSEELIKICKSDRDYEAARLLFAEGKYEEAITAFKALRGYKDSDRQVEMCRYEAAADLVSEGKYEAAIESFEALQKSTDSTEQIEACKRAVQEATYNMAMEMMDSEQYEEASNVFRSIHNYKDFRNAAEMILECSYLKAMAYYDHGEYAKAYREFRLLDYKNSEEMMLQALKQDVTSKAVHESVKFGVHNWTILDKQQGKVLLIVSSNVEKNTYSAYGSATWDNCYLRGWLNRTFLSKFKTVEQELILSTEVSNPNNARFGTNGGNNTTDRFFLLNIDEANRYFASDSERSTGFGWLLRTPGRNQEYVAYVSSEGSINYEGTGVYTRFSSDGNIRPAFWLDLSAL